MNLDVFATRRPFRSTFAVAGLTAICGAQDGPAPRTGELIAESAVRRPRVLELSPESSRRQHGKFNRRLLREAPIETACGRAKP